MTDTAGAQGAGGGGPPGPGEGFGVENLPFGTAWLPGGGTACVSALGTRVVDLSVLDRAGCFAGLGLPEGVLEDPSLNRLLALGRSVVEGVRRRLADLIASDDDRLDAALTPRAAVDLLVPVEVGDFVDFSASLHHALNMGRLFRPGADPLPPHWRRLPRAYHGRAGSIVPSGSHVIRPHGQVAGDDGSPVVRPTRELDFEAEVGLVVGRGNEPGRPVRASAFADHAAGLVLVNDWSARDVQRLESAPLGPFLAKSFATSVSPWLVTLDALEPYRLDPAVQDPAPADYLAAPPASAYDVHLEVSIQSEWMRVNDLPPAPVSRCSFAGHYWTFPQLLAHATVNGAPVRPGDLFASGAVSGPERGTEGTLAELSLEGREPVALPDGTTRTWLEDGDTVIVQGWAGGDHRPLVSLGEVSGTVRAGYRLST